MSILRFRAAVLLTVVLLLAMPASKPQIPAASAQNSGKPNIVVILTDDQDRDSVRHMPYVNGAFRDKATVYPNASFTQPLCCPSRVGMLTGLYQHNSDVIKNDPPDGGYQKYLEEDLPGRSYPAVLQRRGYDTAGYGKFLNGFAHGGEEDPPGFDTYESWVRADPGFEDVKAKNRAVAWLRDHHERGDPSPFLLYVSLITPHWPYEHEARYVDLFEDKRVPRVPTFNEADVSDKPPYIRDNPPYTPEEIAGFDEDYRDRLRGLQTADDAVLEISRALAQTGELRNTYVVFWTDNGYTLGNHRTIFKQHAYTDVSSFPMFVSGLDFREGATDTRMVTGADLLPTFSDISGEVYPGSDGRSLLKIADGSGKWRSRVLIENLNWATGWRYAALRDPDELYVEYADGFKEYYDLEQDPQQAENAYDALGADKKADLAAKLAALEGCRAGTCKEADGGP